MKHTKWIPILAVLVIVAMITGACRVEDVIPRGAYQTDVYVEQGGAKLVVESGGEIEMQSGSTLDIQSGTTSTFGGDLDVDGTLQAGSDDNYMLGFATSGYEIVCGTETFTGDDHDISITALTAVKFLDVTMATDPGTGAGDPALVTIDATAGNTSTVTVNCWQDDWTTAATSSVTIEYCAVGTE